MATPNVFSGSLISRATIDQQNDSRATFPLSLVTGATLSAAQVFNGIVAISVGAPATVTLPLATSIGAALFGSLAVGDTLELVLQGGDANVYPRGLNGNTTGGTAIALATIVLNGNFARFLLRCTAAPTNAAGLGTTFTVYRAG